jgi:hypothetical protein
LFIGAPQIDQDVVPGVASGCDGKLLHQRQGSFDIESSLLVLPDEILRPVGFISG